MDAIQDQDAPSSFSPISSSDEDSLFSDSDTEIDLSSDELQKMIWTRYVLINCILSSYLYSQTLTYG